MTVEPLDQLLKEHDVYLESWNDYGMLADDVPEEVMKELPYSRTAGFLHDWYDFRFVSRHLVGEYPYSIEREKFIELLPKIRKILAKRDNKNDALDAERAKIGWGIFYTIVFFGLVWGCVEYSSRVKYTDPISSIRVKTPTY